MTLAALVREYAAAADVAVEAHAKALATCADADAGASNAAFARASTLGTLLLAAIRDRAVPLARYLAAGEQFASLPPAPKLEPGAAGAAKRAKWTRDMAEKQGELERATRGLQP